MAKKTNLNQEFITVGPKELIQLITRCMHVGRPAMIWGPPGIGKSDIIAQIGAETKRPVIDLRLLLMEPTDIKGIPFFDPQSQEMRWAKPAELPGIVDEAQLERAKSALEAARAAMEDDSITTMAEAEGLSRKVSALESAKELQNAILFLDEINAAPQSVQAAAYQLILNRKVGEYHLPKDVSIVAAGNREMDKAVTFRMPSALANRFIHFELKVNYEDWQDWAITNHISADVIGFLAANPSLLFQFEPTSGEKAFATPRSWVFVDELINEEMSEHLNTVMVAGTVGQGIATNFMQHLRLKGKLPKPRDILEGLVTKLKKDDAIDISAKYSLVIGLCYMLEQMQTEHLANKKSTKKDWNKITDTFLAFMMADGHFSKEMVIMGAVSALRKYSIEFDSETPVFCKFYDEYERWIVG